MRNQAGQPRDRDGKVWKEDRGRKKKTVLAVDEAGKVDIWQKMLE
jgi:hypothetical protein